MQKRIVIGSFEIESNSLTAVESTRKDFSIAYDDGMYQQDRICVVEYLKQHGCEVIPTLYAGAVPGGRMVRADFEQILNELLIRIPEENVDGVWLFLHGAMDVTGVGSGDLAISKAVRQKVGPNVPIAVVFDLHADVDPDIADYVNIVTGFRTAPHTDIPRTQIHAAQLLLKCIDEAYLPKPQIVKVPIIAEGDSMTTDIYPGDALIEKLWDMEEKNDILCMNLFLGNPWVDAVCAGGAVVAIPTPGKENLAGRLAKELAQKFWDVRSEFHFRAPHAGVDEGIAWAQAQEEGPVFLTDTGDNISGGGSGDNGLMLKALLSKGVQNVLVAGITDPEVVETCKQLQYGDTFRCVLGGKLDPASVAVPVTAVYKKTAMIASWPGLPVEAVVLGVAGIDVIVFRERTNLVHIDSFKALNLDPANYHIIVMKLGYLWPEFYDVAKDCMMIFTKGSTCEVVADCDFRHVPRPIYPLDKDMQWTPEVAGGNKQ